MRMSCHRLPRLTALRRASPSEPSTVALALFPPMVANFFDSDEKALPTTGMLSRRIHPPLDFSRPCGRGCATRGFSA